MRINDFSIEELKEYFRFDMKTGDLCWRKASSAANSYLINKPIRYKDGRGYYAVGFKGAMLLVHHIIYRLVTDDEFPENFETDHINGNRIDNRLCNLRLTTRSQNMMNSKPRLNCTSKYKGVYFNKYANKWHARIKKDGIRHNLGMFVNELEAAEAYNNAAKELFGKFKKLNIIKNGKR